MISHDYFMIGFYQEIPVSPFKIKVDPSHDAGKVRAEGPGLNKTGEIHRLIRIRKYQATINLIDSYLHLHPLQYNI